MLNGTSRHKKIHVHDRIRRFGFANLAWQLHVHRYRRHFSRIRLSDLEGDNRKISDLQGDKKEECGNHEEPKRRQQRSALSVYILAREFTRLGKEQPDRAKCSRIISEHRVQELAKDPPDRAMKIRRPLPAIRTEWPVERSTAIGA